MHAPTLQHHKVIRLHKKIMFKEIDTFLWGKKNKRNKNSLTKAPQIIHIFSYKSSAKELVVELFVK